MNSIRSREIPLLNLTNSSYGTNRGVRDFPGRSKVDIEVGFWFLASQDAENHRIDAHMVAAHAVGLARCGDPFGGIYQQLIRESALGDHIKYRRLHSYTLPWKDNKEVRS
jgi:hypothetical protein